MSDRRKLVATDSRRLVVNRALERGINRINNVYVNYLTARLAVARKLDAEPNRDIDKETGVPELPDSKLYWDVFCKEGIANRAVRCMPDECWALYPEVYEDDDPDVLTDFETGWNQLVEKKNVFHYLHRADVASRVATRGGLFIGLDDGRKPEQPVLGFTGRVNADGEWVRSQGAPPKERKITFLMPFPEHLIDVHSLVQDSNSPLYMQPEVFQIKITGTEPDVPTAGIKVKADTVKVHWTRILSLADNRIASDVTGHSTLEPILNRIYGLRKTLGSAPEMFYKGAFPGISFETHPDLSDEADLDKESIKKEIEEYAAGLKRYMRLIGMTAKSLAPQVADPTNHFATLIQAICATLGIPMRIFLGSEAGHLASTQDRSNWLQRVGHRQLTYLEPMVLRPFVDRCVLLGVIPKPKNGKYFVDWKDLYSLSLKEKADVAVKKAQALLQYVTSGAEKVMPLKFFLTMVLQLSPSEAKAVIAAAKNNPEQLTKEVWNQPPKQLAAGSTSTNPAGRTGASGSSNSQSRKKPRQGRNPASRTSTK